MLMRESCAVVIAKATIAETTATPQSRFSPSQMLSRSLDESMEKLFLEECVSSNRLDEISKWLPNVSQLGRAKGFIRAAKHGNLDVTKFLYFVETRNRSNLEIQTMVESTPNLGKYISDELAKSSRLYCPYTKKAVKIAFKLALVKQQKEIVDFMLDYCHPIMIRKWHIRLALSNDQREKMKKMRQPYVFVSCCCQVAKIWSIAVVFLMSFLLLWGHVVKA